MCWVKGSMEAPAQKKTKFTTLVAEAAPVSAGQRSQLKFGLDSNPTEQASGSTPAFRAALIGTNSEACSVAAGMISSILVTLSASSANNTMLVITTASSMKLPVIMARPDGSMEFHNELLSEIATAVGGGSVDAGLRILGTILQWFRTSMRLKGANHLFASSSSFRNSGSMQLDVLGTLIQCRDPGMELSSVWVIHNLADLLAAVQAGAGFGISALTSMLTGDTVVQPQTHALTTGTLDLRSKWQRLAGAHVC